LPEDDAATIAFKNIHVHIPTTEQWNELLGNSTRSYVGDYHGVIGYVFTSKINGNEIFIPQAGYYRGNERIDNGEKSVLMVSDLSQYENRKDLCMSIVLKDTGNHVITLYRNCGFSIRPVYSK